MNRLPFGTLLVSGLLLGACAQLIGLSDYEETSGPDDAGEDGGGRSGNAGSAGRAGSESGTGGDGATGGSSGRAGGGGTSSGSSGEAGEAGETGQAGRSQGGSGGRGGEAGEAGDPGRAGTSGEAGAAGDGGTGGTCVPVTLTYDSQAFTPDDPEDPKYPDQMVYFYVPTPEVGAPASEVSFLPGDTVDFEFYSGAQYNGEDTGVFNLAAGDDGNYESCARCIYAESGGGAKRFFQASGTMRIDSASNQMAGAVDMTVTGVTLVEVTIDSQLRSTPVVDGECLYIENQDIVVQPPAPDGWTCSDESYYDGYCDCGCGILDPACASALAGVCDSCGIEGSCTDLNCTGLNVENNAVCGGGPAWPLDCPTTFYGDASCDCGCGATDIDCTDATEASCDWCWCVLDDKGICDDTSGVDPANNTVCL